MPTFNRRSAPVSHRAVYQRRVTTPTAMPKSTRQGTNYVGGLGEPQTIPPQSDRKNSQISLDLTTSRAVQEFVIAGSVIYASNSTSPLDTIDVRFDDPQADPFPLKAGDTLSNYSFNRFFVSNSVQTGSTMTLNILRT